MSLLPVFLKLEGRPCLVVGAGEVATGKIESLVHALARVSVVAPWARPEVVRLAEQRAITWHRREFQDSDIEGAFVIVAGTNYAHVNQHVYRLAVRHNILCNAVDDPPHCDFYYGSVVARGKLQIAISTAGESPSVAQRLRAEIDALLPHELGPWLCRLGVLRREVLEAYPAGEDRKQLLAQLSRLPVCESPTCPAREHAFPPRPWLRSHNSVDPVTGEGPADHPGPTSIEDGSLPVALIGKAAPKKAHDRPIW